MPVRFRDIVGIFEPTSSKRVNRLERVAPQMADKQNKQPKLIISIKPVRTSKKRANRAVRIIVRVTPYIGT